MWVWPTNKGLLLVEIMFRYCFAKICTEQKKTQWQPQWVRISWFVQKFIYTHECTVDTLQKFGMCNQNWALVGRGAGGAIAPPIF